MRYAQLGSISHGTCRTEDLLEEFAGTLEYLVRQQPRGVARMPYRELLRRVAKASRAADRAGRPVDGGGELVDELRSALEEFAPSGTYFGANEGDSSDYGFWPDWHYLEDSGEVRKFKAGTSDFEGYEGDAMLVTDHGNVSFGYVHHGRFMVIWDCV